MLAENQDYGAKGMGVNDLSEDVTCWVTRRTLAGLFKQEFSELTGSPHCLSRECKMIIYAFPFKIIPKNFEQANKPMKARLEAFKTF